MLKFQYGHVLVLPSRRLVHPVADDDFVFPENSSETLKDDTAVQFSCKKLKIEQQKQMNIKLNCCHRNINLATV